MYKLFLLLPVFFLAAATSAQSYKRLHSKSIVIDTHNDIPNRALSIQVSFDQDLKGKTHSDLQRMREGGVDAQFFSIWCDGKQENPYRLANRQMDTVLAWTARNPRYMQQARSAADIKKISARNKLSVLFGVEGGHMIENDLDKLEALYTRGARYMTLTWNNSTDWATSAADETTKADSLKHKGLTDFGKQVVRKMNALGMMVDLSHVGEQTFKDVIELTNRPVLVSHSCVYALCASFRNLKDDQIKAIGKNGGVIQLNFFSGFLDPRYEESSKAFLAAHKAELDSLKKINPSPSFRQEYFANKYAEEIKALRPPASKLIDHLDYIVKMIGVDHVGLGSDFDGITSLPLQLDDVTSYPLITKMLLERGYNKKEIRKILGGNLLRVFEKNQLL